MNNPALMDFLRFLDNYEEEWDYGDFKRQGDLYLQRLIEAADPITHEQALQLQRIRERLLWSYEEDVEEMRKILKEGTVYLRQASSPEEPRSSL